MILSVIDNPKHKNQATLHSETAKIIAPCVQVRVVDQVIPFLIDDGVPKTSIGIPPAIRKCIAGGLRINSELNVVGVDHTKASPVMGVSVKISTARKLKAPISFYPSELEVKILPEMLNNAVISNGRIIEIEYMDRTLLLTLDQVTTVSRSREGKVTSHTVFACWTESVSINLLHDPESKSRGRVVGSYDVLEHIEECGNRLVPFHDKLARVKTKLDSKEPLDFNEGINVCVRETEAMEFLVSNIRELLEGLDQKYGRPPTQEAQVSSAARRDQKGPDLPSRRDG